MFSFIIFLLQPASSFGVDNLDLYVMDRCQTVLSRDVVDYDSASPSELITFKAPQFHLKGSAHQAMFHDPQKSILTKFILEEDWLRDSGSTVESELYAVSRALVLSEPFGGPTIHKTGIFVKNDQRGYYVRMEMVFPRASSTFTLQGTEINSFPTDS